MLRCGDCNRPMVGAAGHGEKNIFRYYVHRPIPGEKVVCNVKTIRADLIEQRVLDLLDDVLVKEGHLDKIEGRIDSFILPLKAQLKAEKERREMELVQTEKEIAAAFKLHADMGEGIVDELFKERFRILQSQKSMIKNRIIELDEIAEEGITARASREAIQDNLLQFQKAKKTASKMMLKRLIQKVLLGITLESTRAGVDYWTVRRFGKDNQDLGIKKASEDHSSDALVSNFYGNGSKGLLPVVSASWAEAVVCSDIIKNGRGDRI